MTNRVVFLILVTIFAVTTVVAAKESSFADEQTGLHAEVALELAFILPVLHAELRYYPLPGLSVSAFVAAGYVDASITLWGNTSSTEFLMTNVGLESRGHLYLGSMLDLHAGAGVSLMSSITRTVSSRGILYANLGGTIALSNRIRIDLDTNVIRWIPASDPGEIGVLPVIRVRYVF